MKRLLSLLLFGMAAAFAQAPDCIVRFGPWTDTAVTTSFDNRTQGCFYWVINYQVTGFSAISLAFESATGTVTPGAFGNYSGTVDSGVNPNTSTTPGTTSTFHGFVSWYRVNFASHTGSGTISGVLQGYKTGAPLGGVAPVGGGCPGTVATPCVVIGPTAAGSPPITAPALVAGQDGTNIRTIKTDTAGDVIAIAEGPTAAGSPPTTPPVLAGGSDGTNIRTITTDTSGNQKVVGPAAVGAAAGNPLPIGSRDDSGNMLASYSFPDQAAVSISAGTDTVLVTGVASTNTYIGHLSFTLDSAQTVTIRQGTGSTCGTNTATLAGPYTNVMAFEFDFTPYVALKTSVAARDICLHLGGSATAGGVVIYGTH